MKRPNMKPLRFVLPFVVIAVAAALAQSGAQKPEPVQSDAQKAFNTLKTLAGEWEGHVTMNPPMASVQDATLHLSLRVASMGNTLMHEMHAADYNPVLNPGKQDDPITMFVVDGDRLLLTHYCDANNRPRMAGRISPDGKTVEFDFLDVSGNLQHGHMQHAKFTIIDANHHTEDWTFLMPGDKPMQAHLDAQRKN
jgi:hypothetical protein